MPKGRAIIEGGRREVNGTVRPLRSGMYLAVAVWLVGLALTVGCSDERRAERGHRQAMQLVERDDLEGAVTRFDEVAGRFPQTEAGKRALRDAKLYRGLIGAVENFPEAQARDALVVLARALEARRARDRRPPERLDELDASLPRLDPWGNPFGYERSADGRGYRLTCYGSDGTPGGAGDAADVVVENGAFRGEARR